MKKTFCLLSLSIAVFCLNACAKSEWKLVWSDEFNGKTLNEAYWNVEDNARGGGNAELQYYTPKNITFERHPVTGDKCLVINAQRENYGNRPCTSARLNTHDKVTVEYGKVEARIAFPYTGNGLWPAFWMLGNNLAKNLGNDDSIDKQMEELAKQNRVVWPKCGEIDICEMGHHYGIENGISDRYFNGACHWGESFNNGAYPNYGQFNISDYPVQGDFHLFTLIWTEDSIAMYLDLDKRGKTASLKEESLFPDAEPYFQLSLRGKEINQPGHYFNHPFYLVLNLAVGGFFPNMPAAEKYPEVIPMDDPSFMKVTALPEDGSPAKMYVDYIRVFRKNP